MSLQYGCVLTYRLERNQEFSAVWFHPGAEENRHTGQSRRARDLSGSPSCLARVSHHGFSSQNQHFTVVTVHVPDSISFHSLPLYHSAMLVFMDVFKHASFSLHLALDMWYSPGIWPFFALPSPSQTHLSDSHLLPSVSRHYIRSRYYIYFVSACAYLVTLSTYLQHASQFVGTHKLSLLWGFPFLTRPQSWGMYASLTSVILITVYLEPGTVPGKWKVLREWRPRACHWACCSALEHLKECHWPKTTIRLGSGASQTLVGKGKLPVPHPHCGLLPSWSSPRSAYHSPAQQHVSQGGPQMWPKSPIQCYLPFEVLSGHFHDAWIGTKQSNHESPLPFCHRTLPNVHIICSKCAFSKLPTVPYADCLYFY